MKWRRIEQECTRCGCYYLNWGEDVESDLGEAAQTIDCTLERRTEKNVPCMFFQPMDKEE